ncbi:MAG: NUDIX hydrolase [Rubricoccaceae bacterium]
MLLFYPTAAAAVPPPEAGPFVLFGALPDARAAADALGPDARVLVLRPDRLAFRLGVPAPGQATAQALPPEAVLNVDADGRYWPPLAIEAAGGYVLRRGSAGPELLLIHRRGAWDLPKGKLDSGETPARGALREVSEEVGVPEEALRLGAALGPTTHAYLWPRRGVCAVKTTHWFAMTTDAERFTPQAEEDIHEVAFVPWREAGRRLGFASLRAHHARLDPVHLAG